MLFKKNKIRYTFQDLKDKKYILHHHLGLGDHITMNGMVNYLSKKSEHIFIPAKNNNFKTINFMFANNKKISVFKIGDDDEYKEIEKFSYDNKLEILKVGFEKLNSLYRYNEAFYNQLDLDYKISFDYFDPNYDLDNNIKLEHHLRSYYGCKNEYIILHVEGSRGSFPVDSLKISSKLPKILIEKKSDIFKNIFYYLDVINHAQEVHCINSSIFTLAERIPTNGNLFFHNTKKEQTSFL